MLSRIFKQRIADGDIKEHVVFFEGVTSAPPLQQELPDNAQEAWRAAWRYVGQEPPENVKISKNDWVELVCLDAELSDIQVSKQGEKTEFYMIFNDEAKTQERKFTIAIVPKNKEMYRAVKVEGAGYMNKKDVMPVRRK